MKTKNHKQMNNTRTGKRISEYVLKFHKIYDLIVKRNFVFHFVTSMASSRIKMENFNRI